ncbi:MAG: hypothetical protein HFG80_10610 [Eubacterium sp.]|jgi:hypothetical protein|nr:hypothetical protein [Eubacterium sp.]
MRNIKDIINFVDTIPGMLGKLFMPVYRLDFVSDIKMIILQWREYKDLEEQGKLLKLPCKAGQKAYLLRKDIKTVIDGEITSFDIGEFGKDMRIFITDDNRYTHISFDKVGDIVFFTQNEAEAALKELEDNRS